jgi:hypothetical protein
VSDDAFAFWSPEQIATAAGCDVENVRRYWPKIHAQLALCNLADRPVLIAAIGTAAVESGMQPIHEYGTPADWTGYEGGAAYAGRGFIQTTHRSGYAAAGRAIAQLWGADPADPTFDLVTHPDNLLDPDMAAAALAIYFRDHKTLQGYSIPDAARAGDWDWVRRLVYGGPDPKGTARIAALAKALGGIVASTPTLIYNPDTPPERQVQKWACSIRTATWMLKSLGVRIDAGTLQGEMVPRYVTPDDGLLDGHGNGLADVLRAHLPAETRVEVLWAPSWGDVVARAGRGPIALGSGSLYHWLNVARLLSPGVLDAPNPAPNYPPGEPLHDDLTRAEFDKWAPWALVFIEVLPVVAPVPAEDPSLTIVALRGRVAALTAERDQLVVTLADIADRRGDLLAGYAADIQATVESMRADRQNVIGKRPGT